MPPVQSCSPGIFIDLSGGYSNTFGNTVNAALERIQATRSGRQLLGQIALSAANGGKAVTIREFNSSSITIAKATESQKAIAREKGVTEDTIARKACAKPLLARRASGSSALVNWNPDEALSLDEKGRPLNAAGKRDENFIVLAHELHHARKMLTGTSRTGCGDRHRGVLTREGREELSAVKMENKVREESDLRKRTQYNLVSQKKRRTVERAQAPAVR